MASGRGQWWTSAPLGLEWDAPVLHWPGHSALRLTPPAQWATAASMFSAVVACTDRSSSCWPSISTIGLAASGAGWGAACWLMVSKVQI